MKISSAEFITSNTDYKKCPAPVIPELAFIGRSNVGKSSLINMLVNKKKLAKTSNNPGKTQTINHFKINDKWYLVDLPGYGFAKISQAKRTEWQQMIYDYLKFRKNLVSVFVLIDSRLDPQKNDLDFINQLGEDQIPFGLAFTKADKQTKNKTHRNVSAFMKKLSESWETLPTYFISSAETGEGREDVLNYIEATCAEFKV
ncbi:MAG: ribosome biogenesis GTP-binding protein YihA/YsxC [Bacteroidia bacterium]